jgi:tRNA(fMet)-specific endonuclease VapC
MYLLDSDHCSKLLDNDATVTAELNDHSNSDIATSVISQGELVFMANASRDRSTNVLRVSALLSGIRIYSLDSPTAEIYGRLKADLYNHYGPKEKAKRRHTTMAQLGFGDNDLWIAALAIQHGFVIVSVDTDFQRIQQIAQIKVESWMAVR